MKDRNALRESWRNQFYVWRRLTGVRLRSRYYRLRGRCGETDYIYGACQDKRGHLGNWHQEYRRGDLGNGWHG